MSEQIVIPSSPVDRDKIKQAINEMTLIMYDIRMKQGNLKDIVSSLKEQYQLSPKIINKMAKLAFNRNYEEYRTEIDEFEELYQSIMREQTP